MAIKGSFCNLVNMLLDWDDVHNTDFCSWRGVFCDNVSFSVVSLNLCNLNLGGEISPAIGDLRNLQSIDLLGNKLSGQIPDEIGNCASLVYLDFSDNLLYGDIPFSISKLKQLETMNLKNNQLTGPVPATLTQIPNLKRLNLSSNNFKGKIPVELGHIINLDKLNSRPQMTFKILFQIAILSLFEHVVEQTLYYSGMKLTTATFTSALCNALPAMTFIIACIFKLEKVTIKNHHSQAKLVGTMVAIGGAMLMTFVKGNVIELPWRRNSRDLNGHSHAMNIPEQEDIARGSIMLVASCFSWSCYIILQVGDGLVKI